MGCVAVRSENLNHNIIRWTHFLLNFAQTDDICLAELSSRALPELVSFESYKF